MDKYIMLKINPSSEIRTFVNLKLDNPSEVAQVFPYKKRTWQLDIDRWHHGMITVHLIGEDEVIETTAYVPFAWSDHVSYVLQRFPSYQAS